MPDFINVGPKPDTNADLTRAIGNWQNTRIATSEFMQTVNRISLELSRWEDRKREHDMTIEEYNKHYEGYGDDEFLVGRRR